MLDAGGAYLVPGLIDTHLHVESAMVTVARFAEAVLPHGTTTVLIDNHEIANVLGLDGIRWMLEEGRGLPLKVLLAVPSCVPALPGFEDAGAHLGPDDIREALTWDGVAALGEMMNMPGVYDADADTHEMIGAVLDAGLPVTGHWSLHGWSDHRLHAYVCAGVDSDHETVHREDALAKLRAGMWVQFREGSAWHDVAECVKVLTEDGVDSRHALLVTDDMHPETLLATGHLNHAVRTAIAAGLDPLLAIQLATVNAAEYIGRRHDVGSIAPGRCADILLVEDLTELRPHRVIADGRTIDAGAELPRLEPPAAFRTDRHPSARSRGRTSASRPRARPCGSARSAWSPARSRPSTAIVEAPVTGGAVEADPDSTSPRRRASSATAARGRSASASSRAGPRARRGRDDGRPRQPQPLRRRDERRRHAPPSSACRGRGRHGRRRGRRDDRRGRAADRRPALRPPVAEVGGAGPRRWTAPTGPRGRRSSTRS